MNDKELKDHRKNWFKELAAEYDGFSEEIIREIMNDFENQLDPYETAILYVNGYVGDYAISEAMISYLTQ